MPEATVNLMPDETRRQVCFRECDMAGIVGKDNQRKAGRECGLEKIKRWAWLKALSIQAREGEYVSRTVLAHMEDDEQRAKAESD
ncbi:hypothetical protein GCM10009425_10820 [Pseudomonas asuensis]|uniref:Uncharacterized protein n=1 Tax=Pseudomonas asuensis TaxID=1825787 RepID=A0ABQ2GKX5_9PSED|nr:hypothetical protein GCM10009425_10820 [Pseudomonas asuensis]